MAAAADGLMVNAICWMDSQSHPALRHPGETGASSGSVEPESLDVNAQRAERSGGAVVAQL